MSGEDPRKPPPTGPSAPASAADQPAAGKRALLRVFARSAASLAAFVTALLIAATWYTGTADFQGRLRNEVVRTLQSATGGRVEVGQIRFSLWGLATEADGLVIHGTEGPGQMPYLAASRIILRAHFNMVLTHIRGLGAQSRISLRYLRIEQPRFHLIVYPDGHTNAPAPIHPHPLRQPLTDTLLNLQARQVELVDGTAMLNDRVLPFNLEARDVNASAHVSQPQHQTASGGMAPNVQVADLAADGPGKVCVSMQRQRDGLRSASAIGLKTQRAQQLIELTQITGVEVGLQIRQGIADVDAQHATGQQRTGTSLHRQALQPDHLRLPIVMPNHLTADRNV